MEGFYAGRLVVAPVNLKAILDESEGFKATPQDGVLDLPTKAIWGLSPMGPVLQATEDLEFGRKDIAESCPTGIYEVVEEEGQEFLRHGFFIRSSLTVLQGAWEAAQWRLCSSSLTSQRFGRGVTS